MCLIMVCLTRRPRVETFSQMEKVCPHGVGLAWAEDGKVHWMKRKAGRTDYLLTRLYQVPLPFVVHFRRSGPVTETQPSVFIQPFRVAAPNGEPGLSLDGSTDSPVLFFHGLASGLTLRDGAVSYAHEYAIRLSEGFDLASHAAEDRKFAVVNPGGAVDLFGPVGGSGWTEGPGIRWSKPRALYFSENNCLQTPVG